MDHMEYPWFQIIEERGILPWIKLPENFKELVPRFYENKGMEEVTEYVNDLEKMIKETELEREIKLKWDKKLGLTNIGVGMASGLDLNDSYGWPSFQEHNLGTITGFLAGVIAMKYILELNKVKNY